MAQQALQSASVQPSDPLSQKLNFNMKYFIVLASVAVFASAKNGCPDGYKRGPNDDNCYRVVGNAPKSATNTIAARHGE